MIATHSAKLLNARLKQAAVRSRIIGVLPPGIVSSQSVKLNKEFWAAPANAADMKRYREEVSALPSNYEFEPSLPSITEPQLKQLLLPTLRWQEDDYISTTPVYSLGLIDEWNNRQFNQKIPSIPWTVQPIPAAMANHGEMLLMRSGKLNLMRRGIAKIQQGNWRGNYIEMTARCEGMNVSAGMIAKGFPAITAVGGMVHVLERATGSNIEFAIGFKSMQWYYSVPRLNINKTSAGGATTGRVKGRNVTALPGYTADEVMGHAELVLLLRSSGDLEEIAQALGKVHRLAGGRLFDVEISIKRDSLTEPASYLIDATSDIVRLVNKGEAYDALDAAIKMHAKDGEWQQRRPDSKKHWFQYQNGYTLNATGYAFLEQPIERPQSRNNGGRHAWSEGVFSLVTQGPMSDMGWWRRDVSDDWVLWRSSVSQKLG